MLDQNWVLKTEFHTKKSFNSTNHIVYAQAQLKHVSEVRPKYVVKIEQLFVNPPQEVEETGVLLRAVSSVRKLHKEEHGKE